MKKVAKRGIIVLISFVASMVILFSALPMVNAYSAVDRIIDIAMNEEGYTANGGFNKYGAEFGNGYTAWCNYFVVWCAKQAGVPAKIITGYDSYDGNCYSYMNSLRSQGLFFPNDSSYVPEKGDLVFYNSSKSTNGAVHIGLVISGDENSVKTVEGNVTVNGMRGVGINNRPRYSYVGNMIIIGFASPAYSGKAVKRVKQKAKIEKKKEIIDVKEFKRTSTIEERKKVIEKLSGKNENEEEIIKSKIEEENVFVSPLTEVIKPKF